MKQFLSLLALFIITLSIYGQTNNPNYDSILAIKLGADDYGMKKYVFVMLKSGTNESTDAVLKDSCFRGHTVNINRLVEEDKLIVAGPMLKNDNSLRGIFILNAATIEDAKVMLEPDLALKAKLLAADYYIWYGSAALPEYLEASDKIWKINP